VASEAASVALPLRRRGRRREPATATIAPAALHIGQRPRCGPHAGRRGLVRPPLRRLRRLVFGQSLGACGAGIRHSTSDSFNTAFGADDRTSCSARASVTSRSTSVMAVASASCRCRARAFVSEAVLSSARGRDMPAVANASRTRRRSRSQVAERLAREGRSREAKPRVALTRAASRSPGAAAGCTRG